MFFEVGSYRVHIYSLSVPYRNHWSVQPQFGEAESRSSPDAQLCTAVNGVQVQSKIIHLKHGPPKKIYISSSVRYIEKFHTALHHRQTASESSPQVTDSVYFNYKSQIAPSTEIWYRTIQSMEQKAGADLRSTDPTANKRRGAFVPQLPQLVHNS